MREQVQTRAHAAALQIGATAVVAYGAYFIADAFAFSGIFATIAGGIALRYYERRWISLSIADDVNRFWDLAALVAHVLVFFMVGAALQVGSVAREPAFIVATLIAIALSRVVVAGLLLPAGYPRAWLDVVRFAGMRGALSLALALALPAGIPYRQAIVDATFARDVEAMLTADFAKAWRVGRAIESGTIWINTYKQFSISTPFSGWKESGMGREKGRLGIREYMQQKSLYWGLNDAPLAWAN